MKITKSQLREIIRETIKEYGFAAPSYSRGPVGAAKKALDDKGDLLDQASKSAKEIALGYLEATEETGEELIGTKGLARELSDMAVSAGVRPNIADIVAAAGLLNKGITLQDLRK